MTNKTTVEIFICMNSEGEYEVGTIYDDATERYNDNIGGCGPLRVVRLIVAMSPPQVTEAGTVNVPDEAGETVTAEAAE